MSRRFVGWYTVVAYHTSCELRYVLVDVGRSIVVFLIYAISSTVCPEGFDYIEAC